MSFGGLKQAAEELPIFGAKAEILQLLRLNDFVVVVGDTGSGKTTQIPSYLLDADNESLAKRTQNGARRAASFPQ